MTRETVRIDTWLFSATSLIVILFPTYFIHLPIFAIDGIYQEAKLCILKLDIHSVFSGSNTFIK